MNIKLLILILKRNANETYIEFSFQVYGVGKNPKLAAHTVAAAVGKRLSHIAEGNDKWYNYVERTLITAVLQKNLPIIYE